MLQSGSYRVGRFPGRVNHSPFFIPEFLRSRYDHSFYRVVFIRPVYQSQVIAIGAEGEFPGDPGKLTQFPGRKLGDIGQIIDILYFGHGTHFYLSYSGSDPFLTRMKGPVNILRETTAASP